MDASFNQSVEIIAEIGVNHNGDFSLARELIHVAKECGADVVKFQYFQAERVVHHTAAIAEYQARASWSSRSQLDLVKRLELSTSQMGDLIEYSRSLNISCLVTPFDLPSLRDVAEIFRLDRVKIASGDITYAPLLDAAARLFTRVILSTGGSSLGDVERALGWMNAAATRANLPLPETTLLHCVSNYPADERDMNLRAIQTLREATGLPVGLSDHTMGSFAAPLAVAVGATTLEKHITLDRSLDGPDHAASMDPESFRDYCALIRSAESALGTGVKAAASAEHQVIAVVRRSIVTTGPIARGASIDEDQVECLRVGHGRGSEFWNETLASPANRDYAAGEVLDELETLTPHASERA